MSSNASLVQIKSVETVKTSLQANFYAVEAQTSKLGQIIPQLTTRTVTTENKIGQKKKKCHFNAALLISRKAALCLHHAQTPAGFHKKKRNNFANQLPSLKASFKYCICAGCVASVCTHQWVNNYFQKRDPLRLSLLMLVRGKYLHLYDQSGRFYILILSAALVFPSHHHLFDLSILFFLYIIFPLPPRFPASLGQSYLFNLHVPPLAPRVNK